MKIKIIIAIVFTLLINQLKAGETIPCDSIIQNVIEIKNIDSLLNSIELFKVVDKTKSQIDTFNTKTKHDTVFNPLSLLKPLQLSLLDSLYLEINPLCIDLVYHKTRSDFDWKKHLLPYNYFFGKNPESIESQLIKPIDSKTVQQTTADLRQSVLKSFSLLQPKLFIYRYENLPATDIIKTNLINGRTNDELMFIDIANLNLNKSKLVLPKFKFNPWTVKARTLIQFSQNFVSDNWYQGGSKSIAILGILSGQLNYDNKKNIQWDNNAEWRAGFNSVEGAIRALNTNDDIFKINSKLGFKASGNWFYTGAFDFSTQFFNNYKSITSNEMKAAFLTPVRVNIGAGMDYKYKKLFSLMLAPIAYKYIYVDDIVKVNPNTFGIKKGEKVLSEIGSSIKAKLSYSPSPEIQFDSKLSFYTNYEKVEIDWEIVSNFTINRFLSTRLSVNPRYDNTQILAASEKARIQFKELLSFGISYKLID